MEYNEKKWNEKIKQEAVEAAKKQIKITEEENKRGIISCELGSYRIITGGSHKSHRTLDEILTDMKTNHVEEQKLISELKKFFKHE